MRLTCLPVSLFSDIVSGKMSIRQWAHEAKIIGLDAIDISIMLLKNHTPVYLKKLREDLKSENMNIIMAATYPDFTHPDELQRERELEYLRHDIAVCSYLGIRYIRVLAGQAHPGVKIEDGIMWAVEKLTEAARVGEKYGVILVYEDHSKPGAWEYVDFSHPTEIFLRVFAGIKDTSIKVNFDTGNIVAYGDDPIPVLRKVMDKVETVHISDMAEYGKLSPVVIGTGVVPNREIFALLKQNGFNGWLSIEEASNTGLDGIKKAVSFVRNCWAHL